MQISGSDSESEYVKFYHILFRDDMYFCRTRLLLITLVIILLKTAT